MKYPCQYLIKSRPKNARNPPVDHFSLVKPPNSSGIVSRGSPPKQFRMAGHHFPHQCDGENHQSPIWKGLYHPCLVILYRYWWWFMSLGLPTSDVFSHGTHQFLIIHIPSQSWASSSHCSPKQFSANVGDKARDARVRSHQICMTPAGLVFETKSVQPILVLDEKMAANQGWPCWSCHDHLDHPTFQYVSSGLS